MPQPGQAVPANPTAKSERPVEIFRAGTYDGKEYPVSFLKQVVENFKQHQSQNSDTFPRPTAYFADAKLAKSMAPTIGIGHEDDQAFLRHLLGRTDLPSAGRPTDLYLDGDKLMASFAEMPLPVASMVNSGELPTSSAEFYPNYTDEATGREYGPMLRRVSLLGGEIPKVKGLKNPVMTYSERRPLGRHSYRTTNTIIYFSEVGPTMDRAAMLAALQECGMDVSTITDAVDDATLGSLLKLAQQAKGAVSTNAEPPAVNAMGTVANQPAMNAECNPDGTPKKPVDQFSGSDEIRGSNKAGQIRAMWHNSPEGGPEAHSEKKMAAFAEKAANAAVAPLLAELGLVRSQLKKFTDQDNFDRRAADRQTIAAFCERMSREGKVTPFELADKDASGQPKPSLVDLLMNMDDVQKVVRFGEKNVSVRESWMNVIDSRPATRHGRGEQMPQVTNNSTNGAADNRGLSKEENTKILANSETGRRYLALVKEGKIKDPALA